MKVRRLQCFKSSNRRCFKTARVADRSIETPTHVVMRTTVHSASSVIALCLAWFGERNRFFPRALYIKQAEEACHRIGGNRDPAIDMLSLLSFEFITRRGNQGVLKALLVDQGDRGGLKHPENMTTSARVKFSLLPIGSSTRRKASITSFPPFFLGASLQHE